MVGVGLAQQRAAELRLLVAEDDARAGLGRGERRGEARRAGADDEHVAMGVALRVAVGIGRGRRPAEARRGADARLVDLVPERARPHEGLVVEAGDEERREEVVDRADVEVERRPAVLARRLRPS